VNLSEIQKMNGPAVVDDYAMPQTAVLEPEVNTPAPARKAVRKVRGKRGPEFYKPFHYLLLVYLFFYCSRIPEMVPALHVGYLLQPILLIGMIMTETTKTIFKSDIGRAMARFTAWIAICVPFAVWRGGAFDQFTLALQALVLLVFMAAFIRSMEDCYRVILVMALAMAVVGVLSLVIGGGREGSNRLGLGSGNDTLSDANFLALFLVVGLPLLIFSATMKRGIMRIALILMLFPVLAGAAKTGSRSGLLALAAAVVFFLIHASAKQKVTVIVSGIIFIVCAAVLLPPEIQQRFTTYFNASSAAGQEAADSAGFRKELLTKSLILTAEHPLFGVGPGEFMEGEAKEAAAHGQRGVWHYTHNSFTELSSECGILGLAFYAFALWRAFRGLTPLRERYPNANARRAALFVQITVLVSAIGAFFLSIAYGGIVYAIMGLSMAMQLAARREYQETKAPVAEPAVA
jgi:O-antigen ligase